MSIVTIQDVACRAGVSASTVSRALRDNPNVRADVKLRVRQVAEEMGYRPNPLVTALMEQIRSHKEPSFKGNLAYLAWCPTRKDLETMPVLQRFQKGVMHAAESQGWSLETFFPIADGMREAALNRILVAKGISGVILQIHVSQDPATREILGFSAESGVLPIDLSRFATAVVGGRFHTRSPHFSQTDQYAGGRMMAEEFLARGYIRPAIVISSYIDVVTEHRFHSGFQSVWSRARKASEVKSIVIREGDFASAIRELRKASADVVACYTSALLPAMEEAGWSIPGEIGFATMDARKDGTVAGIDQLHEEVGAAAVNLVINQLNRDQTGLPDVTRGILIEGGWVEGATVRKWIALD